MIPATLVPRELSATIAAAHSPPRAILRWMTDGALDWQQNGFMTPQSVVDATQEYFEDQDLFGQWLDEECVVERENTQTWTSVAELFVSWSKYAKQAGEEAGTKKRFGENMRRLGFSPKPKKRQGKTQKGYLGVERHQL